jgi:hypothetical protein
MQHRSLVQNMSQILPAEIQITELPDGVRYLLPIRQVGPLRFIGLLPIAFGVVFCSMALYPMAQIVKAVLQPAGPGPQADASFAVLSVPFIVMGLVFIVLGLFLVADHTDIEIKDGRLRVIERAGPFYWTRSRPADRIRKMEISTTPVKVNDQPVTSGPLADFGILMAECEGAKRFLVVFGYPRNWLKLLAAELARRCNLATGETLVADKQPAIEIVEAPLDPTAFRERPDQPAGSKAVLERHADGLTLTLPPAGVWRGSKGLFVFSLLWLALTFAVGGGFVVVAVSGGMKGMGEGAWLPLLIFPLFLIAGIAMLLSAINMGRRQAVFAVVGDTLMVLQTGIFGVKRREWSREQLADVRTGPSGMEINDKPIIELQIHPTEGKKFGLLAGRDEAELQWVATVLRHGLCVPKTNQESSS